VGTFDVGSWERVERKRKGYGESRKASKKKQTFNGVYAKTVIKNV
jgi:stalled ribosome alternative rescue factor ArfA